MTSKVLLMKNILKLNINYKFTLKIRFKPKNYKIINKKKIKIFESIYNNGSNKLKILTILKLKNKNFTEKKPYSDKQCRYK